jgi:hypothetical protein
MGHKHYYWVYFPQGIKVYHTEEDLKNDNWYSSRTIIHCKSIREAENVMIKYVGGWYEKLVITKNKRMVHWAVYGEYGTSQKECWDNMKGLNPVCFLDGQKYSKR